MVVADTGPLVACFDPQDKDFSNCHTILKNIRGPLHTTEAVLTEAFHILSPGSRGATGLMQFVLAGYARILPMDSPDIARAFELMEKYADRPMDYADASVLVIAEKLRTLEVFTLDRAGFSIYKIKKGFRHYSPRILGP